MVIGEEESVVLLPCCCPEQKDFRVGEFAKDFRLLSRYCLSCNKKLDMLCLKTINLKLGRQRGFSSNVSLGYAKDVKVLILLQQR